MVIELITLSFSVGIVVGCIYMVGICCYVFNAPSEPHLPAYSQLDQE